jgi:elongation factor G
MRILRMHANYREDVDEARAGDIVAVVGPKVTMTGDTLCDRRHPILLERIEFPEPVVFRVIEAKDRAHEEKMVEALQKLAAEDPTLKLRYDQETGQLVLAGMGRIATGNRGRPIAPRVQCPSPTGQTASRLP